MDQNDTSEFGESIYAFITDGEGLVATFMGGVWVPLVTGNPALVAKMTATARETAKASGKTVRLFKYTRRETVEVFKPGSEH